MMVPPGHVLVLAALLFILGVAGAVLRRNVIIVLMSIELMLNAVNLTLATAGVAFGDLDAHIYVFFSLSVAAAEVAVGLTLVVAIFRALGHTDVDDVSAMHG
jgi:NADH-quinone oxidoreductase subunit K